MRRFVDLVAVAGLVFVLAGLIGTIRIFQEEYGGVPGGQENGFVPIFVGEWGSAPGISTARAAAVPVTASSPSARTVTLTPLQPVTSTPENTRTPTPPPADTVTPQPTATDPPPPTETAVPTPQPTDTAVPAPPDWLEIPAIGVAAPVYVVPAVTVWINGEQMQQWSAPNEMAAGWHEGSALAGQPGNTVLNGHHNIYGSVFANLSDLEAGDEVHVWGEGRLFRYRVVQTMLLEERYASIEARQENARWILPSTDTRLTLVSCWPPESNTHRLVVVAQPVQ